MKRSTDNRRSPAEIKADLYRHYGGLEHSNADMTDFRRPAYSVRHPKDGYADTQNMSTGKQNEAKYPESEYVTQNMSMAGELIRAQGEQIRRMSAEEYLKDKSRETVKRNRGLLSKISTEADGKDKWSK